MYEIYFAYFWKDHVIPFYFYHISVGTILHNSATKNSESYRGSLKSVRENIWNWTKKFVYLNSIF